MYVCMYICMYDVCMYVCKDVCMYVCVYVCGYVCMYVCVSMSYQFSSCEKISTCKRTINERNKPLSQLTVNYKKHCDSPRITVKQATSTDVGRFMLLANKKLDKKMFNKRNWHGKKQPSLPPNGINATT